MKKILTLLILLAVFLSVHAQKDATLIIHNAKVITLDDALPQAQAVAISNDKVLATGTDAEMLKYKLATTKIINANGRTVIPGLYDSHLHVIRAGRFYNTELRWDGDR